MNPKPVSIFAVRFIIEFKICKKFLPKELLSGVLKSRDFGSTRLLLKKFRAKARATLLMDLKVKVIAYQQSYM